jgi:hypothetical protein
MIHLLLFKYGGGQDDALAPLLDARAQKKRAQVLLHRTWADAEFGCDLFIATTLDQQLQNLLVATSNFDLIEVQHFLPLLAAGMPTFLTEARPSPKFRRYSIRKSMAQIQALKDSYPRMNPRLKR